MMTRILIYILFLLPCCLQSKSAKETHIRFETTLGSFTVALFNDTPIHRDNFIRLVKEGYYDGQRFHRVIADFMVQAGDPNTRIPESDPSTFGEGGPGYTLPGEFFKSDKEHPYQLLHPHLCGAVAMAREGDNENPERRSAGSQFYVVVGKKWEKKELEKVWKRVQHAVGDSVQLSSKLCKAYIKHGGTPHLDGQYTVFGHIVRGMSTIKLIDYTETDPETDIPLTDILITRAYVVK